MDSLRGFLERQTHDVEPADLIPDHDRAVLISAVHVIRPCDSVLDEASVGRQPVDVQGC